MRIKRIEQLLAELPKPDYEFRKWGYSAMYQTELEKSSVRSGPSESCSPASRPMASSKERRV